MFKQYTTIANYAVNIEGTLTFQSLSLSIYIYIYRERERYIQ